MTLQVNPPRGTGVGAVLAAHNHAVALACGLGLPQFEPKALTLNGISQNANPQAQEKPPSLGNRVGHTGLIRH